MEGVGSWMKMFGRAVYNGRPYIAKLGVKDFILRDATDEKKFYLFKYDLSSRGDQHVTLACSTENDTVKLDGFSHEVESVKWMDNGQEMDFKCEGDELSVACISYAYGTHYCVRVAEITTK